MDIHKESKEHASSDSLLQWGQWQLLDSILPTGGFAHSFGLEAAIQARIVSGPEDLQTFVIHHLENTASLLLPFVYSTTISPDLESLRRHDKILDAMLTNEVGRKASIAQGSALMRVAAAVYSEIPSLKSMRETSLSNGVVSFHHAPMFGLICGLLGLDSSTSQRAFMFVTMRDVISAATRLNLVGPLGAAVLQHHIAPISEAILNQWKDRPIEEACQTVPLLDIVQGCHSYLFSRLFCS
ncbi:putative urease accessory protein UreF [Rosa chinensis]|uniref:Putative urease accessory protein UreF n=1 Tax=Rosa chinensis TaxID=74649 RepID=A0A2P6PKN1_ROSCH|nr:urease accessory protein F [Rosa chinensis]PRQ22482.1 putative urease accessory protein UreF [Rosa chinensis]